MGASRMCYSSHRGFNKLALCWSLCSMKYYMNMYIFTTHINMGQQCNYTGFKVLCIQRNIGGVLLTLHKCKV